VNGRLFFALFDSVGNELWTSDGTGPGTVRLKDIHPTASSNPSFLTAIGSTLFFAADDGTTGAELWRSDGTADRTQRVADLNPGPASSSPSLLVEMGGTLFFRATDGVTGTELWRSDGTTAGTVQVKDIVPGAGSSPISELAVVNDTLFVAAFDGVNGYELWTSDGTTDGTRIVKDINPGFPFSFPQELTDATGRLRLRGLGERWDRGGHAASVGAGSRYGDGRPSSFTVSGTSLFFAGTDELVGRELWAIPGLPPTTSTSSTTSATTTTSTTIAAVLCRPTPIPTCIEAAKGRWRSARRSRARRRCGSS
jgi:ELWxxDGT repeat protein